METRYLRRNPKDRDPFLIPGEESEESFFSLDDLPPEIGMAVQEEQEGKRASRQLVEEERAQERRDRLGRRGRSGSNEQYGAAAARLAQSGNATSLEGAQRQYRDLAKRLEKTFDKHERAVIVLARRILEEEWGINALRTGEKKVRPVEVKVTLPYHVGQEGESIQDKGFARVLQTVVSPPVVSSLAERRQMMGRGRQQTIQIPQGVYYGLDAVMRADADYLVALLERKARAQAKNDKELEESIERDIDKLINARDEGVKLLRSIRTQARRDGKPNWVPGQQVPKKS